jgi:hypothetical protein
MLLSSAGVETTKSATFSSPPDDAPCYERSSFASSMMFGFMSVPVGSQTMILVIVRTISFSFLGVAVT